MRFLLSSILFVGIFLAPGFALECFTCYDCPDPFDRAAMEVQTCTLDNIFPEAPVTTTTVDPTEPTTDPTTEPTTVPTTQEPSTEPTTVPTTQGPTTEPTTAPTNPTNPPSTEPTTVTIPTVPSPVPTTEGPPLTPAVKLVRRRRQANPEFRCFSTTNESNGTFRGCTRMLTNDEATCAAIGGEGCRLCNENGCNTATNLAVSVISLLVAVFVALRVL